MCVSAMIWKTGAGQVRWFSDRSLYSCLLGIILWTGDNNFDTDCHSTVKESREKLIFIEHMLQLPVFFLSTSLWDMY